MSLPFAPPADRRNPPSSQTAAMPSASPRKAKRRKAIPAVGGELATVPSRTQADDLNPGFDAANLRRCPGCGGMVYLWPCLACQHRRAA